VIRLALLGLLSACKAKQEPKPEELSVVARDAGVADVAKPWPELEGYPRVDAVRVVALPAKVDLPRFDVSGPVIAGDIAIVASSQFGFLGIDWRSGTVAWSKPAGIRVAPPAVLADGKVVLAGECANPPQIPDAEFLVGCVRVVTANGTDVAYTAIRGTPAAMKPFFDARGKQALWPAADDRSVRWRRGEHAIAIDLVSGAARPASAEPPPLVVEHAGKRWEIRHVDGRIVATGAKPWQTEHAYTALVGAVWLPEMTPIVRVANAGSFRNTPEIHLLDIDATGSLHGTAARPGPGIGIHAWGTSPVGDAAIAIRVDASLQRDVIVGWAANALLMWVYALPEIKRVDPIGVAVTPDAVVVFHDGDTFTVLPELSAPPTSPGAPARSSGNPTP
jgi:hypothetical protein